ncbi:MAG: hypothetical protein ACFB2Z_04635 [Maricaulaceae bacterium]
MTGADLRKWRKAMGLDQIEAAALLGYGRAGYQNLEARAEPLKPVIAYACIALWHRLAETPLPWSQPSSAPPPKPTGSPSGA